MATWYLSDTDITAGVLDTLTESAPGSADSTTGWEVDKKAAADAPTIYHEWWPDTYVLKVSWKAEPSAFTQYGYRTTGTLSGDFASGNWTLYGTVVNDATYFAQQGYVKYRLWRSTNADGSGATQITSGWQSSTLIQFSSGSNPQGIGIVVSLGAVTLTSEYLFLEVEWQCHVSGGANAAAVYWTHNDGTARLLTPTFTESADNVVIPVAVVG